MATTAATARVRLTEDSLTRVGVELMGRRAWLACEECGKIWSPNLLKGGRLPRGWWRCPTGCNAPDEGDR